MLPKHIAFIMDGNGRWAQQRGKERIFGHQEGLKRIKEIIEEAQKLGIKILTFFAFSTENWKRPRKEIDFLFSQLKNLLKTNIEEFCRNKVKINFIGRRDRLEKNIKEVIEEVENFTKENTDLIVNIALDYGGRWDILQAAKKMVLAYKKKDLELEAVDEDFFKKYLCLGDLEEVDLLIRTSGELRISNFLLWQCAYSEFYFTTVLWPDFNREEFKKALEEFSKRKRRFGGL